MVETELVAQDGLACSRRSHDEIATTLEEATLQDAIQSRNTTWHALRHRELV